MKRVFSFILSLVILFSTLGFTTSTHFCGGKKIETKFSIGKADVSCGMETDQEKPCTGQPSLKSDCCKNVYQNYEVEDDYTQQLVKLNVHQSFIIALVSTWFNVFNSETTQADYFVDCSPPPLIRDIPIFTQSFLI